MPRKMRAEPEGIIVRKTSQGTWFALEEIWSADGKTLLDLRPMRGIGHGKQPIIQARERAAMLAKVDEALMSALVRDAEKARREVAEMERRLKELSSGELPGARYAATG